MASPYAHERRAAVVVLSKTRPKVARIVAALSDDDRHVRAGAAQVIATVGDAAAVEPLRDAYATEVDRMVRNEIGGALFGIVTRLRESGVGLPSDLDTDDVRLRRAAREFVFDKVDRFQKMGTQWTDHRRLAFFGRLGPFAAPALISIVGDENVRDGVRELAAVSLGRVDAEDFWVDAAGGFGKRLAAVLDTVPQMTRVALFYASTSAGVVEPSFMARVADYAENDAVGPFLIEACLYNFYGMHERGFPGARPHAAKLCIEFSNVFHAERVRANAGILLRRLEDPKTAKACLESIDENEQFGGYFLYDGILGSLVSQPMGTDDDLIRKIVAMGLAQPVPQVRALCHRVHEERFGAGPEGSDLETHLAAVRSVANKVHSTGDDEDFYCQRSAAVILGRLKDKKAKDHLREMLRHPAESVRMAAAMAAGEIDLPDLVPDLVKVAKESREFAAFGAAWALLQVGDRRGLPVFVDLLECGNDPLRRPALVNLRWFTKMTLVETVPETGEEWRVRAKTWRERIAK